MTTNDRIHQLGLIRDYKDYLAAKQDIENLREKAVDADFNEEVYDYLSATRKHIELFESYLDLKCSKPQARDLLAYLLCQVKKVTVETLESEAGITDVGAILTGHRMPTPQDAGLLSKYFDVTEDAVSTANL